MRAVFAEVPQELLDQRRRTGADRWDEMWDGVLHMTPSPNRRHQDLEFLLEEWLRSHWARPFGNRVYHQVNLSPHGGWPHDYRIPDLLLVTPDRFAIDHDEYFEGPPLVVVEIHSPGDESYEKLDFYAELGVPEVWIIHRDTRKPEMFAWSKSGYQTVSATDEGWFVSAATGVWLKARRAKKLLLQFGNDESTRRSLPEN